jgi:caffeic acid 3-O-methyltransferase
MSDMADQYDEAFANAMQMPFTFIVSSVFNTAIELGLLDIISKNKEISPSELATHLPTKNKNAAAMLDNMLRLLTTHSILNCRLNESKDGNGEPELLYKLSSTGELYVEDVQQGRPYSLTSYFLFSHIVKPTDLGYHLKDAILEGGASAFERTHGMPVYKISDVNPNFSKKFDTAMSAHSCITVLKILEIYKGFLGIKSLVDVGGGIGTNLQLIASKYPSMKCINFDLPHVIKDAPPLAGIEHVAGNMFVEIPKSEVIMMKSVCHNWDDEDCVKILKKCFEALPENGKVITVELLLPVVPSTSVADKYISQMDNLMLIVYGTKVRTLAQFEALAKAAGFSKVQFRGCGCMHSVVEFLK